MLTTVFIGAVLAAAAVGTASATTFGTGPDSHRAMDVVSGNSHDCVWDGQEWKPRTLKEGGGSARMSDGSFGDEEILKRSIAARNCALV